MLDWILVIAALAFALYIIVSRVKRGGAAGLGGGCDSCTEKGGCAAAGHPETEDCASRPAPGVSPDSHC